MISERSPEFFEWIDSAGPHGWVTVGPETSHSAMVCWTVGYVLHETAEEVVVAGTLGFDGPSLTCANSPISIPLLAVTKRLPLAGGAKILRNATS